MKSFLNLNPLYSIPYNLFIDFSRGQVISMGLKPDMVGLVHGATVVRVAFETHWFESPSRRIGSSH